MACKTCVDVGGETGRNNDGNAFDAFIGVVLVPMVANDNTPNCIDLSVTLDQAFWDAFLNDPDLSKRGFPIRDIKNADSPIPTAQTREFSGGEVEQLGLNSRIVNSLLNNGTNEYLGKIESFPNCGRWGVLYWDDCPRLKGNAKKTKGFLYPVEISKNTFLALLDWARKGANSQDINLTWNHTAFEKDSNHGFITDNTFGFDLLGTEGVTGVDIVDLLADAATDEITFKAETCFGDQADLNGVPVFASGDFTITIDLVAATIDTFVNNNDGTYSITTVEDIIAAESIFVTAAKDYFAVTGATVAAV